MGRRFITAKLMAMKATKLRIFIRASILLSDSAPTSPMALTIPMGPDMSLMPALPLKRSTRLILTSRTISTALYQLC